MGLIARLADKTGTLGAVVSTMGCAMCFPAVASIGAALGLGFLARWEGVFVNTLLPLFAGLALLANALGWLSHRQWHRSLLGMLGPALVLASLYVFCWSCAYSTYTVYAGLAMMLGVAAWDLWSPAHRRCGPDGCEVKERRP